MADTGVGIAREQLAAVARTAQRPHAPEVRLQIGMLAAQIAIAEHLDGIEKSIDFGLSCVPDDSLPLSTLESPGRTSVSRQELEKRVDLSVDGDPERSSLAYRSRSSSGSFSRRSS
ncbi:hypothetical protein [Microbispora rosea]|uniref:hypothetical protein n=1 Tax=Microbispora rosea TaxID=58117 RepID=UPI003D9334A0